MDHIKKYQEYLTALSLLTHEAFEINIYLTEVLVTKKEKVSNRSFVFLSIFSKIMLQANSVLILLPKKYSKMPDRTEDFRVVDLSSVASLTRDIIDADNILFYLFTDRVDISERKFRLLLYALHGFMKQKELLDIVYGPHQEEKIAGVLKNINSIKNQLNANSFFKVLEQEMIVKSRKGKRAQEIFKRVEGNIVSVKDPVFLTRKEIIKVREMNVSSFDADYMFLSNLVHSYLMGTSLIGPSIALSDRSLLFLLRILKNAVFYLCLAIIDTTILFPRTKEKLSPKSCEMLQSIMRGEPF